ncbi:protein EARLY FLOWERING 3-like [Vicia villosa]|uniref:protein EARLY FLOWERING 3-like n=1 Tax=Vicia villosa TaxID=3911 RepID=UPI00273B4E9D|nr:protein EARLY FLOWERING 3-like [Vicia villosa]
MSRGKGDAAEKVGPMFPRLHVNDTAEKGGPRAPPRNKMALYEQFSVPFQRFNPNSNSNSSNSLPLTRSSSLGNDPERSYISHQSNGANMHTLSPQLEHRKKVDGDDSRAYDRSRIGQSNDKTMKSFNGEKLTLTGSGNFGCLVSGKNVGDKDQTQFGSLLIKMRKDVKNKGEAHLQEIIVSPVRQAEMISDEEDQSDACLQQESNNMEHGGSLIDSAMDMDNRNSLVLRGCFCSTVDQTSVLEAANHTEYDDTNIDSPIENGTSEGSDDLSKNSTLENMPSPKFSPDGVVELLGQQLFWKARRKITNQQRMYAVQVFELHRLIKVQHLIAESSNLFLLDAAAILGKSPLQGSNSKSLSLEEVVEPQTQNHKQQDHSENLNHNLECSTENGVGKTSFSSQKSDQANAGSQCFNQSPGHQWLIPVMSPSEGLIYKPYPGPGFPGAAYGGYQSFGHSPPDGALMNPAYGVPNFHHAIAMSPFIPPSSYAYFPPHGVPAMNQSASGLVPEQVNQFVAQGSRDRNSNSSLAGANFDTHNQSSCNFSNQKSGAKLHVSKSRPSRE